MQNREFLGWSTPVVVAVFALTAAFPSACAPPAETISGRAKIIDGDSFYIGATEIRLHAIDAFEGRQSCGRGSSTWDCGAVAANKLRALTNDRDIGCERTDIDKYKRTVAICSNGESDLGAEMVRAGLALAYREYGDDYVDEEDEARSAKRGAWSGEFTSPWDERHGTVNEEPIQRSAGCRGTGIKGNINRGKHIYHVPGSSSTDETKIDEAKGERWFCTEDEARRAGWRAPGG